MGAFVNLSMGMFVRCLFGGSIVMGIVAAIYGAGITHERNNVRSYIDRAEKAEADAKHLAEVANGNAATATEMAAANKRQANSYDADAKEARSNADRIELARQAAEIARENAEKTARTCQAAHPAEPQPLVGDAVHAALLGRPVNEDDDLAPSFKAAMDAIRQAQKPTKKGRRR